MNCQQQLNPTFVVKSVNFRNSPLQKQDKSIFIEIISITLLTQNCTKLCLILYEYPKG
jgi:hypothetical protein